LSEGNLKVIRQSGTQEEGYQEAYRGF